jgi:hypothetical protein
LYLDSFLFKPGQEYVALNPAKSFADIVIFILDGSPLKASQEVLAMHMKFSISLFHGGDRKYCAAKVPQRPAKLESAQENDSQITSWLRI